MQNKIFVPKGAKYVFIHLNNSHELFLTGHHLVCHPFPCKSNSNSKYKTYTIAFGLRDLSRIHSSSGAFISGQLDSSHGMEILFNIRYFSSLPQYFLTSFQMPF